MSAPSLISVGEIAALLADRAGDLCQALLPGGRRHGNEWVEAKRAQGGLGDGLSVCVRGAKRGVWSHFGEGRAGDALDLVVYVRGGSMADAVAWAKAWLGLEGSDPARLAEQRRRAASTRAASDKAAAAEDAAKRAAAFRIFTETQPALRGTPAGAYLAWRGIDLARLSRQPRALRYHPALWNEDTGAHWPALVAGITAQNGRIVAVHRTFLTKQGKKAPVPHPKKTLGPYRGGCIRLWRGEVKTPLNHAEEGTRVLISEGIEDGLTAALVDPAQRVLCAVSVSNLAALWLPPAIREVELLVQNDAPDSPAAAAVARAAERWLGEGRRVFLARPPEGVKDVNELLTSTRESA